MSLFCVLAALLMPFVSAQKSAAHPLALGRVEVVVFKERVTLWARVSVEQVIVQQLLPTNANAMVDTPAQAYRGHGEYLLNHLFVKADDKLLTGKVLSITEPDQKSIFPPDAGKEFVTYEIEYPLSAPPALIELSQNVLNEVDFTPGNRWEATYVTGIRQDSKNGLDNLLLISSGSLPFSCDWSTPPPEKSPPPEPVQKSEPPARLKENVEAPVNKFQFAVGVALGIGLIYGLAMLIRKSRQSGK